MPARHYKRAPIREAVIELGVRPRADLTLQELRSVQEGLRADYPTCDEILMVRGTMQVQPGGSASALAEQDRIGFKLTSLDGKQVCMARFEAFALSRLAPYDRWEPFRDEAKRLWSVYRRAARPEAITRLAVRYINRIDLPEGTTSVSEYLRTGPKVSDDLPHDLDGYFMRLSIPDHSLGGQVIINQTLATPVSRNSTSVVLDIDVSISQDVPSSDDEIWAAFERLHVRKNEVFEACISDRARELFQ